ncbi:hypothetical protein SESBI_10151 [Sesbania bispinosa]|nr:hypothetical protein SESBI_10151 [Sesbania bispinosa]
MASIEDTSMLPDPPDGKEASSNLHTSFKDKPLAGKERVKDTSRVDLISNNLFRIEYDGGDHLKPRCYVADSVLQNLQHPWAEAGPEPKMVEANLMESQEQLHGEWLVVSRSRKPNAQKGKGKAKTNSSDSKGQQERDKTANKVTSLFNTSETQVASKENVVFSAKPSVSSRPNRLGKKRSRVEIKSVPVEKGSSSTNKDVKQKSTTDQVTSPNTSNRKESSADKPNSTVIFKPDSIRKSSLFDFGIKTAMNVDIIEPNRLRFKDDEELQKRLDDKLGVFLQPKSMNEERKDSETDSEMDDETDNSNVDSDSDMNEEPTDQTTSDLVQPPSG